MNHSCDAAARRTHAPPHLCVGQNLPLDRLRCRGAVRRSETAAESHPRRRLDPAAWRAISPIPLSRPARAISTPSRDPGAAPAPGLPMRAFSRPAIMRMPEGNGGAAVRAGLNHSMTCYVNNFAKYICLCRVPFAGKPKATVFGCRARQTVGWHQLPSNRQSPRAGGRPASILAMLLRPMGFFAPPTLAI